MNPSHPNFIEYLSDNYNTVKVSFDLTQAGSLAPITAPSALPTPTCPPPAPWQDAPTPRQMYRGDATSLAKPVRTTYTYKVPKEWTMEPGDLVVVPGRDVEHSPALAVVVSVDPLPDIDFDSNIRYKWIIDVVGMQAYNERMRKEQQFRDAMIRVERERQRQQFASAVREQFLDNTGAGRMFAEALKMIDASVPAAPVQDPPAPQ